MQIHADFVFLLWHVDPESDDERLIGVYASEADASAAVARSKDVRATGTFEIDEYEVGKDHWVPHKRASVGPEEQSKPSHHSDTTGPENRVQGPASSPKP